MASSEILSQTLFSITSIKLEQLNKQRNAYESGKRSLLEDAAYETDNKKRAKVLLEGAEKLPSMTRIICDPLVSVENFKRFVQQAQYDPSVSDHFIQDYEETLRNELQVQSNKYEFASLYGRLVNEWIAVGKEERDAASDYLPVGRKESHEQRATWEEYVFRAKVTDMDAIKAYLDDVFTSEKAVKKALESLRKKLEAFQKHWDSQTHFTEQTLSTCIKGMLRSDVLTDSKRATLKDFLGNSVVLSEIADVLNMRMSTRKTWVWESDLIIDQRRNLNGRYRFYPEEDLLQSVFLHYIGMQWAVTIRKDLGSLFSSAGVLDVWKSDTKPISKEDLRRRDFFLNELETSGPGVEGSVQQRRARHYDEEIFLDQLPKHIAEQRGGYGDDHSKEEDTRKSHIDVTQNLLHMIKTEIILGTRLSNGLTVIRSDFKWFGPSIPHTSIFAVLDYFGVNDEWIEFFRKVLEAPLRFKQDPASAPAQIRRRGTPLSTPLADFFGETLLFCVDFAVNQKADGLRLYRLHDDMWLWGNADACVKGWKAMTKFANVVGLDFNLEKTGCARILRNGRDTGKVPTGLPKGDVTWGFLKLDPVTGRFLLNQADIDKHIEELRLQLNACKSVFDWTQAWNIYGATFFTNNFGKPANCYSRAHVDSMLATFQRIQQRLFPDTPGGVGEHLKRMIADRFGIPVGDIPDGYLYFPISLGGLGLKNPFIKLYLIRDQVAENPDEFIDEFLEWEEQWYQKAKKRYERERETPRHQARLHREEWHDLKDAPFMSLEEYRRYRERTSTNFGHSVFEKLMEEPDALDVELKGEVKAILNWSEWRELTSYDKWVVQLFHKDMIARFGGLNIVEKGLLPMGLMSMLRQSKFRWQG
ncbi:hypothetical protein UCRPA7_6925 [Phaeoacremonium minimum UCRPA7]|uniref:Reverse transcriptase domain-containing protein n=1 Tax=Phaeoacremonium minimum (strain UCR-PA7) TaxID=1286976 RepID=R8BE29_PHAM7|nr:hypothetical protein UCRPA7_6925 [Phaeoacremonium minimum UCRPA7]EON97561.1 hypothetical protein UCRPA7_6925 [Phaeoacremonium minimum UCRPA7]